MTRTLSLLGSTGSVGTAALDVVRANRDAFRISCLTAQKNVDLLAAQAREFCPRLVAIGDEAFYPVLKEMLSGTKIEILAGRGGVVEAAGHPADITLAAIVGMAGLAPMLEAVRHSRCVAIANKEPLVAAGAIVMAEAARCGAALLPVDSEHNAIFQVFEAANRDSIHRLILTASGGPFRSWSAEQMARATREDALKHPNWSMGAKITIDSATMMNKALEVIEAHHLFAMPPEKIDVLIHPQSIIHSMVEYADGSVLAQMGAPDMRVPIAHALGWPARLTGAAQRLDFAKIAGLTFEPVDDCRFPAINLSYRCLRDGQGACIAFNAANEAAVEAFLAKEISFMDIMDIVRGVLDSPLPAEPTSLESILDYDAQMRNRAMSLIKGAHFNRKAS